MGWQIYSHGFCVRLRVEDGARGKTLEALRRHLGFGKRTRWSRRGERDCLRGSGWLTARRPGPKTCIGKLNRARKLALYNLAVADRDDGLFIDIQGVRKGDQKRVMEGILGLEASDWSIEYYRRLERYVVLSQPEAERLADELGFEEIYEELGRRTRLEWLIHEDEVPVTIRHRAKAKAFVKLYRVKPERGATAAYRLEAWLEGDKRGKTHFWEKDQATLDAILKKYVAEHELHPIERPAVWEGEGDSTPAFVPRDALLRRLAMKSYRGKRPGKAKCHPPRDGKGGPRLVLGRSGGVLSPAPCISCPSPSSTPSHTPPRPFSPGPSPHGEAQLAYQIAHDSVCLLSEVVMDAQRDPSPLVRHLVHELGGPGDVAVGYIGQDDTWYGVHELIEELPEITDEEMAMIIVVEPDMVSLLTEDIWSRDDGSFDRDALKAAASRWVGQGERTGCSGILTDALDDLRSLCETTGLRVVFVTVDDRSKYALDGQASPYTWSGAIVRSQLGNDGRYFAHSRYLVEDERVVMWKDERHGRPGTIAWQREAPAPAWDVDELLDSLTVEDADEGDEFEKGVGDEALEVTAQIAVGDDDPAKNGGLDPWLEITVVGCGGVAAPARDATPSPCGSGIPPRRDARRPAGGTGPPRGGDEQGPLLGVPGG